MADEYEPERLLIGETCGTVEQVMGGYGEALDGFRLPFNLGLIGATWDAEPRRVPFPDAPVLLSTTTVGSAGDAEVTLAGGEGRIVVLDAGDSAEGMTWS